MSRRKKHEEGHDNSERWLLSYADFITLLMIFFVILYSMSNLDNKKYQQIAAGFNKAMGGGGATLIGKDQGTPINDNSAPVDTNLVNADEQAKLEQVKTLVDKYLSSSGLSDSVTTTIEERGLVLSFKDSLFFDSGKAEIKSEQAKKLVEIGKILNQPIINSSFIRVEGNTDNVPINTYEYKSNMDLSVIRAANVSELLINQSGISPERVSATGYSEYRPKASNNTEEGRASNRRVDILIMNTKFNEVEKNN
ncbi:flagellar motor protein MotB [Candidatus Clostridium stratigraminis]|uniref:Flagellar motor protein MotB n=1 Tax=Candidatus Clostridium stratigraminis TaxID=3381661 RepID=A0ABW8T6B2_9CLOT